ncbi:MAG: hypothetical protein ACOC1O_00400 [bacterium]
MYKVFNKTYQPLRIREGRIPKRDFIMVDEITEQIKLLKKRGWVSTRKM